MKRNDVLIILATAAYSILFYRQSAGANYFIFNVLLILLLLIRDSSLIRQKTFLAAAGGCFISSLFVLWYGTTLPFAADMISLILLAGISLDPGSSFIIACFHAIYSFIGVGIFMLSDISKGLMSPTADQRTTNLLNKLVLAVIPIAIFLVFVVIYRFSNPIFDQLVSRISFDFISISWCFFTIGGFFFMYGFFKQRTISFIQRTDHDTPDELRSLTIEQHTQTILGTLVSLPNLIYTGVLLFILLNLLLATVNCLDIYYIGILHSTPPGITFSQYLHNGTNALIASILMAVSVILFYFRGYINFYENNKWLKNLAYIWIAQNIFLVLSTAYRNTIYISDYGLTHRRIGVYVYLFLCIAGLITTFIKINLRKNNWFLFRKNAWIVYSLMIVACPFDWDSIITGFNISRFQADKKMEIDQRYLADLSHTNLARLFQYYIVEDKTLRAQVDSTQREMRGSFSSSSGSYENAYDQEIKNMIWQKYQSLKNSYSKHSWQSHCVSKSDNLNAIDKMVQENHLIAPGNNSYQKPH